MCRFMLSVLLGSLIPCVLVGVASQSTGPVARCFQYTWLGPRYNNESVFLNATCADATRLASGVPCFHPLVASYDGSWPDVDYIYNNHLQNASCILTDSYVCATYTYYFNNIVENSTHLCTRVIDEYDRAITSGCYTQTIGSFVTKACFCRSIPGAMPCNGSGAHAIIASTITVVLAVVLLLYEDLE